MMRIDEGWLFISDLSLGLSCIGLHVWAMPGFGGASTTKYVMLQNMYSKEMRPVGWYMTFSFSLNWLMCKGHNLCINKLAHKLNLCYHFARGGRGKPNNHQNSKIKGHEAVLKYWNGKICNCKRDWRAAKLPNHFSTRQLLKESKPTVGACHVGRLIEAAAFSIVIGQRTQRWFDYCSGAVRNFYIP